MATAESDLPGEVDVDHTSDEETSSACHRVFSVPELAEAIFLELSMRDVLVSVQRTCTEWRDMVEASLPIQQALFFKPSTTRRFQYYQILDGADRDGWVDTENAARQATLIGHPLGYRGALFKHHIRARGKKTTAHDAFSRPEASWRCQLMTQPPVTRLEVMEYDWWMSDVIVTESTPEAGVRMGDLNMLDKTGSKLTVVGRYKWQLTSLNDTLIDIRMTIGRGIANEQGAR